MKRMMSLLIAATLLVGCANSKSIDGHIYEPYGLANADEEKNPKVKYRVSWGNVFWGIAGFETIILPIYVFGFNLYEPVAAKPEVQ